MFLLKSLPDKNDAMPVMAITIPLPALCNTFASITQYSFPSFEQTAEPLMGGSPQKTRSKWVCISAKDGTGIMHIDKLAGVLGTKTKNVRKCLQKQDTLEKLNIDLEARFFEVAFGRLHSKICQHYGPEIRWIFQEVQNTHNCLRQNPVIHNLLAENRHYKRKEIKTTLPIERTIQNDLYAILKMQSKTLPTKSGSFKRVYFAVNLQTFTPCAWAKVPLKSLSGRKLEDLKKDIETEIASQLLFHNEPEFVRIFHVTRYLSRKDGNEQVGIMMEYCDSNLAEKFEYLRKTQDLPPTQRDLWNILEDLCSALNKLHNKKLHHRDIKLANVFLVHTQGGYRAKVGDFGFINTLEMEKKEPRNCGSPMFMAPEFLKGHTLMSNGKNILLNAKPLLTSDNDKEKGVKMIAEGLSLYSQGADQAANLKGDIWAAGLILLQLRTGKNPEMLICDDHSTLQSLEMWYEKVTAITPQRIDLSFSNPIPSGSLEELNRRMLSPDPAERPSAPECLQIIQKLRVSKAKFA